MATHIDSQAEKSTSQLPYFVDESDGPILSLGPDDNGLLMTPEEFLAVEELAPGYSYELIHGVVVVNPPAADGESNLNDQLGHLLRTYWEDHPQGMALNGTMCEREVLTAVGIRRVDRAIYTGLDHDPDSRKDLPTIIVEFVSPGRKAQRRDYIDKREEYLQLGVKEYWVIDRFRRNMTVFFPAPAEPPYRVIEENDTYVTPLLPGFELPLVRLMKLVKKPPQE